MTAWSELAEQYRPYREREVTAIRSSWPELLELAADDYKVGAFEGMPDQLARRLALVGPPQALAGTEAIVPALRGILDRMDPVPAGTDARYAVTVLSMVNALRCGGSRAESADSDEARERRWLSAIDPAAQSGARRGRDHAAIAAAGCGMPEAALAAAGSDAPGAFDRSAIFGCDLSPFAAHLAQAHRAGAGPDAVRPAWQSFLRNFPGESAANTVQWLDLLWAGRAVYSILGDTPIAEVGARLHREVGA